jgi:gliding motility-associated-like protein
MRLPWFQSSAMPLVMWTGILCLGACGVSLGQARIANGGFEASSGLPTSSGQFSLVDEWTNGGSDVAIPDYYHELGSDGGDLPQTPLAKVDPRSGRAVAGFVAYSDESNPRHEYLTGSFTEPLTVGQRYKMSFAITSGRVHDWVPAGIGVSGLGVVMTNSPPAQQGHERLLKTPQFEIHETLYDRNWREIAFVFTATEEHTYFTFGLFGNEVRLRREEGDERTLAYYFVDDFVLTEVDAQLMSEERPNRGTAGVRLPEVAFVPNAFTPDGDRLNDVWVPVLPEDVIAEVEVFNRWGQGVWSGSVSHDAAMAEQGWDGTDSQGERCAPGVYGWRMLTDTEVEGQTEWKGWVKLIR